MPRSTKELTIEEEIQEIEDKIATIEETQQRKFTQARASMLEKLNADLEWLKNGGTEAEEAVEESATAAASPAASSVTDQAAALEGPSPRSRALSTDPKLGEKALSDIYNREAIAESNWGIFDCEMETKKKLVVVWDFNNTLLPHYKMKRGTDDERALFAEWSGFTDVIQNEHLPAASSKWTDAENVAVLGVEGMEACRAVYESECKIPAEELASLENDTEKVSDGWITAGRKALSYVAARGGLNVILTNAPLKATVAKLILFRMAQYVPLELIYSSNGCKDDLLMGGGKKEVGSRAIEAAKLMADTKKRAKVIVIGAKGKEEEELASMHRATFHKLASSKELISIKQIVQKV